MKTNETLYYSENLKIEDALINRGIFFGESPFTTLCMSEGNFIFLEDHLLRLSKGIETFYPELDWKSYKKEILQGLSKIKKNQGTYSVRITFFKSLQNQDVHFFIYSKEVPIIKKDIAVCGAVNHRVSGLSGSEVKIGNYGEVNLELERAHKNGFDDIIFLDEYGYVTEASTSNIFFRKDGQIFTPELNACLLSGITRLKLIDCLEKNGHEVKFGKFTFDDLKEADEILLTSSIKGLRSVVRVQDKYPYSKDFAAKVNLWFEEYKKSE